jgi:cysteine-rich repeat protein
MNNPAFMASAGDDGSSGDDGGGGGSAGSTTRPDGTTGEPPVTTTATPSTSTTAGPAPVTTTDPATTDPGETTSTSTGVDPDETTGLDPSSGNIPEAVCGNGLVEEGEQCDEGQNEPAPGKCSPDCQALIAKKQIFAFNAMIKGGFMALEVADAECQEFADDEGLDGAFKALISDGATRIGAVLPWDGQASPDWPLHPYTAYFNRNNELVWITLKRPLLGAGKDNEGFALPHAIEPTADYAVWTGLQSDWVSGLNCGQWNGVQQGIVGKPYKLDIYLDAGPQSCEIAWGLICVQQ